MIVVIDTNVLVSGLIRAGGPPAEVLNDILSGELVPLYDERILTEYREVLQRPKFRLDAEKVAAVIEYIEQYGILVRDPKLSVALPDPDDQPFADVAISGGAKLLITGNAKHFPIGARVVSPRDWVEIRTKLELLRRFGLPEDEVLVSNARFDVARACARCRAVDREIVVGLTPLPKPINTGLKCTRPDANQPGGVCGGELWSYDDNDLGRHLARQLGLPTLS